MLSSQFAYCVHEELNARPARNASGKFNSSPRTLTTTEQSEKLKHWTQFLHCEGEICSGEEEWLVRMERENKQCKWNYNLNAKAEMLFVWLTICLLCCEAYSSSCLDCSVVLWHYAVPQKRFAISKKSPFSHFLLAKLTEYADNSIDFIRLPNGSNLG